MTVEDMLNLDLSYFFIKNQADDDEFGDREEITFGIRSQLNENWFVGVSHRRDPEEQVLAAVLLYREGNPLKFQHRAARQHDLDGER